MLDKDLNSHLEFNFICSCCKDEFMLLTERKNQLIPVVYGVKEFVCLSVTNFVLNYLRTGEIVE